MTPRKPIAKPTKTPVVECGLCDATTVSDQDPTPLSNEHFCHGCKTIICDRHDADAPWGQHSPIDHDASLDDENEEDDE